MPLLGVDVGGTFTDFYFLREGKVEIHKRPSTSGDPGRAVIEGIVEKDWRPDEVVHGSTVATNTVLERCGARTAFVATKGFKDLLTIGRQARPRLYDLEPQRPPLLVPDDLCFEADERTDYKGQTLRALSKAEAARVAEAVARSGAEAVAVCLLFSFLNPEHERMLARALRARGLDVSASHEVLPEFREYERASTTALNAYVAPAVRGYLQRLEDDLGAAGGPLLRIIQSSGGTATTAQAAALPGALLLSGPAGGVAGAFSTARAAGFDQVVTFDMGGTSTDVSLCPAEVPYTTEWSIAGLPMRLPSVDVHTVGAGGGSIAWLDAGGALRVGPQSAGAEPGPACYGRGGPPTVTDAQVRLGRLTASSFLDGAMKVDEAASAKALRLLAPDEMETARGVIAVANAAMERALRVVSVERGFDPREFTLVAFGGAGPLHACDLAAGLSIRRVLIPRFPGILSAIGMALADATRDASAPIMAAAPAAHDPALEARVKAAVEGLSQRLRGEMGQGAAIEPGVDMRYEGQGYEITVPWAGHLARATESFHEAHRRRYGHSDPSRAVEIAVVRVRARVRRDPPPFSPLAEGGPFAGEALIDRRAVTFDRPLATSVYARARLRAGNQIDGPAIVSQMDSTTLVPPGWHATVDTRGNLIVESRTDA